ncbi:MAG: hypothetical protein KJO21_03760 [Verrucomicrobiae bacterium]|nr:hypothetical protein [Verrucomicrobiae bacterium]NNJ42615.1 hypothetical protein [Akkermansiaceae bacterium]
MNKKRRNKMKPLVYLNLVVLGIVLAATGYFAGKSSNVPSVTPMRINQAHVEQPQTEQPAQKTTDSTTQAPKKGPITPEAIAKAKNVPATLKKSQGDYTLVTVIEGAEANRRFNKKLQLIGSQRRRLALLTHQFDKAPAESTQERERIGGIMKEAREAFEVNLRFMAKNYAYSPKNNYLQVTHEASLLSVTEEDDKAKSEAVYAFKNAEDYEDFQQKRDAYLRLVREQAKETRAAKKAAPSGAVLVKGGTATPVPQQGGTLAPTSEMDVQRKELQRLYNYDTERNYQVRIEKSALYVRAVNTNQAEKKTPKKPNSKTPQKRVISPEAIAKAKNVPATLNSPQGKFTLVTVVEGADANSRLNQRFQVVGAQRKNLADLSQQFAKTPTEFMQQREMIAGQINETKKALEENIRFMAKNYAYSVKNKYVQVPHQASLLFVTKVDGKSKAERVYVFKNSRDYEDFQKKRDVYHRLKIEQAKAARPASRKAGLALTPEMKKRQKDLVALYRYNPEKAYQIKIEKSALYARVAQ